MTGKKAGLLAEPFEYMMRCFAVTEILRAHRYLTGGNLTNEEAKHLGALTGEQLMAEARMIGTAVALRQQVETAEAVRAALAAEKAARRPETALKS